MLNQTANPSLETPAGLFMADPTLPLASISTIGYTDGTTTDALVEELKTLRAEVIKHRAVEAELMQVLGTARPDRIVHDVRNLLQERIFLLAACRDS